MKVGQLGLQLVELEAMVLGEDEVDWDLVHLWELDWDLLDS